MPPNSSTIHCSRATFMSGQSSGHSPWFNSITVRRVRPSPASEANKRTFCLGMGAPTKALSSVLKKPPSNVLADILIVGNANRHSRSLRLHSWALLPGAYLVTGCSEHLLQSEGYQRVGALEYDRLRHHFLGFSWESWEACSSSESIRHGTLPQMLKKRAHFLPFRPPRRDRRRFVKDSLVAFV
jgi:hypothetical protein